MKSNTNTIFLFATIVFLGVLQYARLLSQSNGAIDEIQWRHDGQAIALGYDDGKIEIVDTSMGVVRTISVPNGSIYDLEWSHNGNYLASSHEDKTTRIWDINTLSQILLLDPYYTEPLILLWNLNDTNITVFPVEEPDQIIDISSGQVIMERRQGTVVSGHLNPMGTQLSLGTGTGRTFVIDANTLEILQVFGESVRVNGGYDQTTSVTWHPSDALIVSGSLKGNISIWDTVSGTNVAQLVGTQNPPSIILDTIFETSGTYLFSIAQDGTVRKWNTSDWSLVSEENLPNEITDAQFSPDGTMLAYSDSSGVFEVETLPLVSYDTNVVTATPVG